MSKVSSLQLNTLSTIMVEYSFNIKMRHHAYVTVHKFSLSSFVFNFCAHVLCSKKIYKRTKLLFFILSLLKTTNPPAHHSYSPQVMTLGFVIPTAVKLTNYFTVKTLALI